MAAGSPLDKRRRLGRELRRLRVRAGLSGPQLAVRMETTQSRISRIETAVVKPKISDVESWCDATDAGIDERRALLALAEEALTELAEWQAIFKGSLAGRQRELMATDRVSREIRHFQPHLVPGPFQTAEYARAAIAAGNITGEVDLEEAVLDRLERGRRILRPRGPRYHAILTEPGIRWQPAGCPHGTREDQWQRLIEVAAVPHVTIQVIPLDAALVPTAMVGFVMVTLKDPDEPMVVRMETPAIHMAFSGADQIAAFELTWSRMAEAALNPNASVALLRRLAKSAASTARGDRKALT